MARSVSSGMSLPEFLQYLGVLSPWACYPVSQYLNFIICKMGTGVGSRGSVMRNETAPGTQCGLLSQAFFSLLFLVFRGPCQPGAKKMVLMTTKQCFSDSSQTYVAGISTCLLMLPDDSGNHWGMSHWAIRMSSPVSLAYNGSISTVFTIAHQKLWHHWCPCTQQCFQ